MSRLKVLNYAAQNPHQVASYPQQVLQQAAQVPQSSLHNAAPLHQVCGIEATLDMSVTLTLIPGPPTFLHLNFPPLLLTALLCQRPALVEPQAKAAHQIERSDVSKGFAADR